MSNEKKYEITHYEKELPMELVLEKYYSFETTHAKCMACSGYGETWACPEYDFDPQEFMKGFSSYFLIVDKIDNSKASDIDEAQDWLFTEKRRFDKEMREIEKTLPGSYALAAQECVACKKCARLSGLPCVHPEIMRYGPEAIGILAAKLVNEELGFPLLWSDGTSIPDYYLLVAGVLKR